MKLQESDVLKRATELHEQCINEIKQLPYLKAETYFDAQRVWMFKKLAELELKMEVISPIVFTDK